MATPTKKLFYLYDEDTKRYQKSFKMTQEEADKCNVGLSKIGQRWVIPVIPDHKGRHIAQLRSICETFPSPSHPKGKPPYCTCGRVYDDPIHFTSKEIDNFSPEDWLAT